MSSEPRLILDPLTTAEPLIQQWYAWGMLVPPQTAAGWSVNYQQRILRSYVLAPQVHAEAARNPAMIGGPYVDYDRPRTDEIQRLLEQTQTAMAWAPKLHAAIVELNGLLGREAKGGELVPLYARVPPALRGYVELVYDLNDRPGIRFLEALLYAGDYYDTTLQSLVLSREPASRRPFVFSTPRLPGPERALLPIPFADGRLDYLFARRTTPAPEQEIRETLGVSATEWGELRRFFKPATDSPRPGFDGEGVRIRYMGHASLLIEAPGVAILVDPCISYGYEGGPERFTFADLPETLDYVLITHFHYDHTILEMLLQVRHKTKTVVVPHSGGGALQDPSLKLLLRTIGFSDVREIDDLECIEIPGGSIMGLPFLGEHGDLDIRCKIAHLVRIGSYSMLCAADACNVDNALYERIAGSVGPIDTIFVGMESSGSPMSFLYGPIFPAPVSRGKDQSRRLCGSNMPQALALVQRLGCEECFVYALGHEPWIKYFMAVDYERNPEVINEADRFIAECQRQGIRAERLHCRKEITRALA